MKKFVVLGGGTAGWITANYIKKMLPSSDVTVVYNEEIGIIGVGEATTPNIIEFLLELDIPLQEVFRECGATIKNGVSFENWNGVGTKYFHGFGEHIANFEVGNVIVTTDAVDFYLQKLIKEKYCAKDYMYTAALSYQNKIDMKHTVFALHFDAQLFSNYLRKVGESRGIKVIQNLYKEVVLKEDGRIDALVLEDQVVYGDFFFDCSGFRRALIGEVYDNNWISYRDHLPMKHAIPFWIDQGEHIEPYTSAIAMKYGWMWKTPLQHRTGCGYVFDSDYITPDQAKQEVEEFLGHPIKVRKVIPFEAGRYESFWVKNCIGVGPSTSFIEPIESTSIFLTIASIMTLKHFLNELDRLDQSSIDQYNEIVRNNMTETLYFVYMHYLCKRDDTEFWRTFREKYPPPAGFEERLERIKKGIIRVHDFPKDKVTAAFTITSYLKVIEGLGLIQEEINNSNLDDITPSPNEYKEYFDKIIKTLPFHEEIFIRSK